MVESDENPEEREGHERVCWQCGETFSSDRKFCPEDGAQLVELDPQEEEDIPVGRVFDQRFRILGQLGEGGMSHVYAAERVDGKGKVALKVLKADFLSDSDVRKRFMYEARVISNLGHPNAVDLFDFGQAPDGNFYMVMELLEGESLADRLDGGALNYREIFNYVPPICAVLAEAHEKDVIHRDLKPENIYLAELGGSMPAPKLLDFGIAKHLRSRTMTKNDEMWGTPAYMSPEQAAGDSVSGTADVYAIGVMLYELIAGVLPFRASTAMGFAVKHMHRQPTPLSELPGSLEIPPSLDRFILQMLQKEPSERPGEMGAVATTLRRIERNELDDELLASVPSESVDQEELDAADDAEEGQAGLAENVDLDEERQSAATELVDEGMREPQPAGASGGQMASASQSSPAAQSSAAARSGGMSGEQSAEHARPTPVPTQTDEVSLASSSIGPLVGVAVASAFALTGGAFGLAYWSGAITLPGLADGEASARAGGADTGARERQKGYDEQEVRTATEAAGVAARLERRAEQTALAAVDDARGDVGVDADTGTDTSSGEETPSGPETTEPVRGRRRVEHAPGSEAESEDEGTESAESDSDEGEEGEGLDEALESTF